MRGAAFARVGWVAVAAVVLAAGCRDRSPTQVETVAAVRVELPDTKVLVGDSVRLTAVVSGEGGVVLGTKVVTWESSDTTVAVVTADGLLVARGAGEVTVTAWCDGKAGSVAVQAVTPPVPALGLEVPFDQVLSYPVYVAGRAGDPRTFVVGLLGTVWVARDGRVQAEPYLDLRGKVRQEGEMGMYAVAFHPRFATNGYLYVTYTDAQGRLLVERYTEAAGGMRADPASAKLILAIDHPPTTQHYGGMLQFGPDGRLYISVGDGGFGLGENAQDLKVLLGKLLRIDVDAGDPYSVPADNPYVGVAGARGEIWASGLRNPWRFSFDEPSGLLYLSDVGDTHWEEINVVPVGKAGVNYGWPRMEGAHCFPPGTTSCDRSGFELPALAIPHEPNAADSPHPPSCAVTGGSVYRGTRLRGLQGHYFYADLCTGWVRSFRYENGAVTDQRQWPFPPMTFLLSFGVDSTGELYVLPYSGMTYRIGPAR